MIKPSAKVNKFKDTLSDMEEYFRELLAKKEDIYNAKSDKWQDSEKGEEVLEETGLIDDVILAIEQAELALDDLYEF